jgi:hypothetical protein
MEVGAQLHTPVAFNPRNTKVFIINICTQAVAIKEDA